jgi:hypothetical protein
MTPYAVLRSMSQLPGSYLSDPWNKLDFVVVIVSWLSVLVEALNWELPIKGALALPPLPLPFRRVQRR